MKHISLTTGVGETQNAHPLEMIKKKTLDIPNWYTKYYKAHYERKNKFRDDLLNPETLYQFLALKKCFVNSLNKISLKKKESRIIDIGCGSASQLINLVSLGFNQDNLFGIDINKVDINFAKKNYPLLNLSWQDATNLDFKNANQFGVRIRTKTRPIR